MGKSAKAKRRRSLWVGVIRRQAFVPTRNTKVCCRHFVSGIAESDPSCVDYIPSVNMGYEKQRSTRRPETSTKAQILDEYPNAHNARTHTRAHTRGVCKIISETACYLPSNTVTVSSSNHAAVLNSHVYFVMRFLHDMT